MDAQPTYSWNPGAHHRIRHIRPWDAAAEFERIRTANGGRLTPAALLREAAKPTSMFHESFTWDDDEAARLYRLEEARATIRALVVVYTRPDPEQLNTGRITPATPTRAYARLYSQTTTPTETLEEAEALERGNYVPVAELMAQQPTRTRFLQQALREALSWRRRYQDLSELAQVFEALDAVSERRESIS